ncbi:MAG TPA: carboxypeptidase regulatory-like domain-containing protein [Tepidisphaeraceae bacterium]|nr:carboxypeptidase regulatory-like domain-containing protein [Tepidisphaeraceae bacterium]
MNEPRDEEDLLLHRAIAALRDEPIAPLLPLTQARTLAAMKSGNRSRPIVRPAAPVFAAILLIAMGAAALMAFVLLRNGRPVAVSPQPAHPAPAPVITAKDSGRLPPIDPPLRPTPEPGLASDVSIRGRVFFHGLPPARREIDLRACPQCVAVARGPIYDDSLVVNSDGTLQNVVVSISGGLPPGEEYPPTAAPVLLDQKGCMFHPHVVAAMVGQNVIVKNSDPLLHTVHSTDAEQTPAFNFAQPSAGERKLEPLQVVETFSIKCDLHPWMNAWMRIFSHPYFSVTRGNGTFEIRDLPPGTYRIKAWHEQLGVRETEVTVKQGQPTVVNFTFDAR